ncbi:MAG: TlpA family protein disulfide reductase [Halanaerobiaceae bacterium]
MKKKWATVITMFVILTLTISTGLTQTRAEEEDIPVGTETGEQAPNFTLENLEGEEVSLDDYRGEKIFLNFWATWCPPCKSEMPDIQKLHEDNENITILTINLQENKNQAETYLQQNDLSFPVLLDTEGEAGNKYLVRSIPTTYIIDKEGIIKDQHIGAMNYETMTEIMEVEK